MLPHSLLAILCLTGCVAAADSQVNTSSDKKLILSPASGEKPPLVGPDPCFLRWLDQSPFDGTTLYPSARYDGNPFTLNPFDATVRWKLDALLPTADMYRKNIAAAGLKRPLENFLYVYCTTGNREIAAPDWFDAEFETVINNWKVLAALVKACGLPGLFVDDELYYSVYHEWDYEKSKHVETKTAEQYYDQAFRRGAQVMDAINEVYPDIRILFLHGSDNLHPGTDPARHGALKFAFMDGMLSKCTGDAEIIEGWEVAYGYRAEPSYRAARQFIKEDLLQISRVPAKSRRHRKMAYALWADYGGDVMKWDARDVLNNYYTPEEMAWAAHCALKHSDRYVWVWNYSLFWFANPNDEAQRHGNASEAYLDAMRQARGDLTGPPPPRDRDNVRHRIPVPTAHKQPGYDDHATFGRLWGDYRLLSHLNDVWKFRIDPKNLGMGEKWYRPGLDLSQWGYLRSGMYWHEQNLGFYDGYGWYRQSFTVPEVPAGRKVLLAFGAVRHRADVYVNGRLAGRCNAPAETEPFLVDVTPHLRSDGPNELAIRLLDLGGRGSGLWKNVLLIADKFERCEEQHEARRQQTLYAHIPRYWKFRIDPDNEGEAGKWYAAALDDKEWDRIAIDRIWIFQKGYEHYNNAENPDIQGRAWYRTWIDVPADFAGRTIQLAFRGVDHVSEVYVNDRRVGGNSQWNRPFQLDITDAVKPGGPNLLVVRIIEGVGIYGKVEARAE